MTTLITGAGLVGTAYALCALERNERVVFLDPLPREDYVRERLGDGDYAVIREDVRSLPSLIAAIEEHEVETVLHTAALIGGRAANPIHAGFDLNIGGTMTVAEAVRLTGVKRVVHMSTFGVYDWRRETSGPVGEDFPRGSGAAYSNSKAAQELILEAYQGKYGFELVILRPGNVFGVGHFWGGSGGGEKVQALLECGIRGTVARIPEQQTMDFVYVYSKDMGRALDLAATAPLADRPVYNIGYDSVTSFQTLVDTAQTLLPELRVEIIPGTPPVSRAAPLDISRAARDLGWSPQYPLEAAFEDYIADLRARAG